MQKYEDYTPQQCTVSNSERMLLYHSNNTNLMDFVRIPRLEESSKGSCKEDIRINLQTLKKFKGKFINHIKKGRRKKMKRQTGKEQIIKARHCKVVINEVDRANRISN